MTKEKLMEIYFVQKEICAWREELENLGADGAREETRVRKKIEEKLAELERIKNEVTEYILNIDDCQTRLIFKLRCLNRLSWNAVADRVGGMNSEDSVKKRFYRYLEKCG